MSCGSRAAYRVYVVERREASTDLTSITRIRCVWNCISDEELDAVFLAPLLAAQGQDESLKEQVGAAKNLIRWCLEGDPRKRPQTMLDVLAHGFFSPSGSGMVPSRRPPSPLRLPRLETLTSNAVPNDDFPSSRRARLSRSWERDRHGKMHYHFFISHNQREASGDVGTLFHLFEARGVHCWRDMTQDNLTAEGMKQGVEDSDVFVLFLTNSMLSRP